MRPGLRCGRRREYVAVVQQCGGTPDPGSDSLKPVALAGFRMVSPGRNGLHQIPRGAGERRSGVGYFAAR
jgi:hypothetical protein